jgi:ATP-dependent helicase HrpB
MMRFLRLQRTLADLRIVVMSATLDADPVAEYFGDCPVLRSEATRFEPSITHLPYSPEPLEARVRNAVELLIDAHHSGDKLKKVMGLR